MWPFYFCHARLSKIIIIRKLAVILLWFPKRSILKIPVIITRGDNHHKRNRLPTSCHDWPMTTERHISSNWLCLYRHLCNLCAWAIQSQNNDISQDMSQAPTETLLVVMPVYRVRERAAVKATALSYSIDAHRLIRDHINLQMLLKVGGGAFHRPFQVIGDPGDPSSIDQTERRKALMILRLWRFINRAVWKLCPWPFVVLPCYEPSGLQVTSDRALHETR